MKVLLLGYGSMGKRHAATLLDKGHEVIVMDPAYQGIWMKIESVRTLGRKIKFIDRWWARALKEVSHVVIASPAKKHYEQAMAAIRAEKNVFIEKPMAMDADEGFEIRELAREKGKVVAVGYNWRASEDIHDLRRRVQSTHNWIGARFSYEGNRMSWPGNDYDDILLECSHAIDLARFVLGGQLKIDGASVGTERAFIMATVRSRPVKIDLNWGCKDPVSRHRIAVDGETVRQSHGFLFESTNPRDLAFLDISYRVEVSAWMRGRPFCNADDGYQVLKAIEAIRNVAK